MKRLSRREFAKLAGGVALCRARHPHDLGGPPFKDQVFG